MKQRDLLLGIQAGGASRAYLYEQVLREKLIQDHVGSVPVLLVVAADGQSVRVFRNAIPGATGTSDFYRMPADQASVPGALFMDSVTGSQWNFQGCAIAGTAAGKCLAPVDMLKDYWFDWRNYNPGTTIYGKN